MNSTLKYLVIGLAIGIAIVLLVFSILTTAGFQIKPNAKNTQSYNENMPEECRQPQGQDIESWKEHLGHHQNTLYCLDYYK